MPYTLARLQYPRGFPVDHDTTHARCILAVRRFVVAFASPAKRQRAKKRRFQSNLCHPRLWIILISTASCLDSGLAFQSCLSQLHTLSVSIVTITFISGFAITILPALQQLAFSHVPTYTFFGEAKLCLARCLTVESISTAITSYLRCHRQN